MAILALCIRIYQQCEYAQKPVDYSACFRFFVQDRIDDLMFYFTEIIGTGQYNR